VTELETLVRDVLRILSAKPEDVHLYIMAESPQGHFVWVLRVLIPGEVEMSHTGMGVSPEAAARELLSKIGGLH
jgi:hypothetical protein